MAQNIPLAIILQVIGSFCFALAAHQQHRTIDADLAGNPEKSRMETGALWRSIRRPRWLLGLGLMGVSLVMQVSALTVAPVSVVQPVGLFAFPWSVLIQHRAARRRIPGRIAGWVALTVTATAGFTVLAAAHSTEQSELDFLRVGLGALTVYVLAAAFGFAGAKGLKDWRSLFWGSGGAMLYGLEASLVKTLIEAVRSGHWAGSPAFWSVLVVLIVGSLIAGWMVQQGYATGHADTVVASMTITSPVIAVLFGVLVLGEGEGYTWWAAALMIACGLIAIAGVAAITRIRRNDPSLSLVPAV